MTASVWLQEMRLVMMAESSRRRIIPEAACKGFKFPMDAVQKSRPLENAGEGSGEADDGGDMEHGYDASPIDHGRKFPGQAKRSRRS